ncbi:LacI family DNA-binding transcriptional regulator [Tateyamaria pelophila]|uniref:LacI family DNA-binding transcriptional regulator n=1 Tax=Tateyamaria pelophila TaxID=328415 RepID=UPI001CBB5658|nr:LacI family DNA-binding transcriptional regulator [Tateyamaria pelophila]
MPKPRINTMEELSAAIGVSRPTLSRFFQDPTLVKANTVARIEKGLAQVEYVPNFFATRLNRKSTGMIGVIIPYLNDLFFTKLLESIERTAMDAGLTVLTKCSHSDPVIEAKALEGFIAMNVDGALVVPLGNQSDVRSYERLRSRIPSLLVDSRPDTMLDVDYVGTNHQQSMGLAVEYLCRVGGPPVFLAMPPVNFNALGNERAYISKMEELGFEPRIIGREHLNDQGHYEAHGHSVMDQAFSIGDLTDQSILCANDRVAIGALKAASQHGLEPGALRKGGLRIMGHDDYPLCPYLTPSLTTVEQNLQGIGSRAVNLLVNKIHGEKNSGDQIVELFDGALQVRESA